MAAIDTQTSFLTFIFNLLTADSSLKTFMGGEVRLFPVWAQEDAEFPYLVHRLDIKRGDIFPLARASYYIDIWADDPNSTAVLNVRKRIIELIDELRFSTNEIANGEIHILGDGFVPETEPDIWHYALQFEIKFYRKSETESILGR